MFDSTGRLRANFEPTEQRLSVAFVLASNFTLTPVATFIDALRLAADSGDKGRQINCQWTIVGSSLDPVVSSCGVEIKPTQVYSDPGEFDYIVVVGGLLSKVPQVDAATTDYLKLASKKHVPLIGVCTGSFILARSGLMKGRRCCVSWFHYHDLRTEFPDVKAVADKLYVIDRDRITCAGGTAAIDLAAYLIERHLGYRWVQKSLRLLVVDRVRKGNAPQPPIYDEEVTNDYVKRTLLLLEQNLCENLNSDQIAKHVNLSKRTLERYFRNELGTSLQKYARQLRLRYAAWMLINTDRSITQVADETGFSDASHFSRIFRAEFDIRPSKIRIKNNNCLLDKIKLPAL